MAKDAALVFASSKLNVEEDALKAVGLGDQFDETYGKGRYFVEIRNADGAPLLTLTAEMIAYEGWDDDVTCQAEEIFISETLDGYALYDMWENRSVVDRATGSEELYTHAHALCYKGSVENAMGELLDLEAQGVILSDESELYEDAVYSYDPQNPEKKYIVLSLYSEITDIGNPHFSISVEACEYTSDWRR